MWKGNHLGRRAKVFIQFVRSIFALFSPRVPAIFHWPGHIIPGHDSSLVSTLDILPTVVTSLGLRSSLLDNVVLDG